MPDLSVIIPYVNEYPLICTTLRTIGEELKGHVDFEVIAVDNWCDAVEQQGRKPDRGHSLVHAMAQGIPWLRTMKYNARLSHWQAKRLAVASSEAPFLFFCDAHVLPANGALRRMFEVYSLRHEDLDGSIHLPLTYHLLEEKRLIYSLKWKPEAAEVHYTFRGALNKNLYEVPCMSSCGLMITRELYDLVGGWPAELGIYGGGENFMNFTLAVLGKKKWICGTDPLYHHGDKRGYNWNFWDYERNRLIATYLFGGPDFASRFVDQRKKVQSKRQFWSVYQDVLDKCGEHRQWIEDRQVMTIQEWASKWTGKGVRNEGLPDQRQDAAP